MAELDPRLIRMLARHFPHMQGLRLIAISVFLQFVSQKWLATHSELWTMVYVVGVFLVFLAVTRALDRWYARFGRVVRKRSSDWVYVLIGPVVTFLLPFPLSGPSFVWTILALGELWIAWDCRPYRWHHLLVFVAMLYVAFGRVAYPNAGDLAWMAPRMWAFTSALAMAGFLDYRLFVRAMRQSRALAAEAS
jgi:hypothetical protein